MMKPRSPKAHVYRALITCVIAIAISSVIVAPAFAHGAKFHKHKPVQGTITNLSDEGFSLKSDAGETKVRLQEKTVIERGHEKLSQAALADGASVEVYGTKLPGGVLVATEIHLGGDHHTHGADAPHN